MYGSSVRAAAFAFIAVFIAVSPRVLHGQMRRSPDANGGPPPEAPKGSPRNARFPFAGVWDGTMSLANSAGDERNVPRTFIFAIADSAKNQYGGAMLLPNGARAPYAETTLTNGEIKWKMPNSGGGFWVYTAKLVGRDSVAGTVALVDWPQLPAGEKAPAGTLGLARRPVGK
jgi:hypothetical protein